MLFFLLLFAAVIFLIACSLGGYYSFWKEKKLNKPCFFVILAVLTANMVIAVKYSKIIPFAFLKQISYFMAVIFFIAMVYSSFFFIIRWIILKAAKHFKRTEGKFIGFLSSKGKTTALVSALVCLLAVTGYINMGTFRVSDFTVNIDKPSQLSELNCAVISDMHIGVGVNSQKLDELTEKINSLAPDVIFLVGDIVDESTTDEDVRIMINAFKNLKSKYGAYYVSGNHEGYANFNYNKYMTEAGITVLEDEAAAIGEDITVIGRKDAYSNRKELKEIIYDENTDTSKPIIVLNHEPLQLAKMSEEGADLTLCGHTHGEQFPFTKLLFGLANDMMYGEKQFGNMVAITTSGAGGWGFHFKLPAKSEIINLHITMS